MRSEKLNQDAAHELDVIDSVVRGGGHARPEDAALTDFALLVRNARTVPDRGVAMRLDERLTTPSPARRSVRQPLFAAATSLMLVILVGGAALVSQRNEIRATSEGGTAAQTSRTADSVAPQPGGPEVAKKAFDSSGTSRLPAPAMDQLTPQRQVARTARLTLATGGERIERLSDRVTQTVDDARGYVANSEVRSGQGDRGHAEFRLMLRSATFQETFADLSRLAHVRSRSQSTEDITAEYNASDRAVKQREDRVGQLESKLASANTPGERASIQRQLARAKFALRQAEARARANKARVAFVPVDVKIVADSSAAAADQGTIGRAVDKAGEILTGIAAALIILLAVGLPVAVVAALAILGHRRWHRGRADRAIGEAAVQPE